MNKKFGFLSNLALVSQIGIMMAFPIIGCIWLGSIIDKKLGTNVLFLIIFTILGVGAAFRNLYVLAIQKIGKKEDEDTDEEK